MGYRGLLERLPSAGAAGRVSTEHGEDYEFNAHHVRTGETLSEGAAVDFILFRGEVRDLFRVPDPATQTAEAPAAPLPKSFFRPSPADSVVTCYIRAMSKRMFVYTGRDRRKDYFSLLLVALVLIFFANMADEALAALFNTGQLMFGWLPQDTDGDGVTEPVVVYGITLVVALAHLMAIVPATIRRLHDAGYSANALWIVLLPYVGIFVLLIQTFQDSQTHENDYGPSPKYTA